MYWQIALLGALALLCAQASGESPSHSPDYPTPSYSPDYPTPSYSPDYPTPSYSPNYPTPSSPGYYHTNKQWGNDDACKLLTSEDIAEKLKNLDTQHLISKVAEQVQSILIQDYYPTPSYYSPDNPTPSYYSPDYPKLPPPPPPPPQIQRITCVQVPTFWPSVDMGGLFWNACDDVEAENAVPDVPEGSNPASELLLRPYYDNTGLYSPCPTDFEKVPFLIGDTKRAGNPEDFDLSTVYKLNLAQAKERTAPFASSNVERVDQLVIAVWLNYLAGAPPLSDTELAAFEEALVFLKGCEGEVQPPSKVCNDPEDNANVLKISGGFASYFSGSDYCPETSV